MGEASKNWIVEKVEIKQSDYADKCEIRKWLKKCLVLLKERVTYESFHSDCQTFISIMIQWRVPILHFQRFNKNSPSGWNCKNSMPYFKNKVAGTQTSYAGSKIVTNFQFIKRGLHLK